MSRKSVKSHCGRMIVICPASLPKKRLQDEAGTPEKKNRALQKYSEIAEPKKKSGTRS